MPLLLHADAESVLELIQGFEPTRLEGLAPQTRHGALERFVVAAAQRYHPLQRLFPALVAHCLLPGQSRHSCVSTFAWFPAVGQGPDGQPNRDLRPPGTCLTVAGQPSSVRPSKSA
jgi:hypothetical protein